MKVKIIATGKAETMPKGSEYMETKEMAAILVKRGAAEYADQLQEVKKPNRKK